MVVRRKVQFDVRGILCFQLGEAGGRKRAYVDGVGLGGAVIGGAVVCAAHAYGIQAVGRKRVVIARQGTRRYRYFG